jgi:hypothetical protein
VAADLTMPEHFEELSRDVSPDQLREIVRVSSDVDEHIQWMREVRELGIGELYLHNVNRDQRGFIDAFARHVLPALRL